jgi:hypothetical protein
MTVTESLDRIFSDARRMLREQQPLRRMLDDLGISGLAREILLAAYLREWPVALSDLVVGSAEPPHLVGQSITLLLEQGHLRIADGCMAVCAETAARIAAALKRAGKPDDAVAGDY